MSFSRGPRRRDILIPLDKIWRLHLQGVSTAAIAERCSLSTRSINKVIQHRREALEAEAKGAAA